MCKSYFASYVTLKTPQLHSIRYLVEDLTLLLSSDRLDQSGYGAIVVLINYCMRRIYNYILLSGARDGEAPKGRL